MLYPLGSQLGAAVKRDRLDFGSFVQGDVAGAVGDQIGAIKLGIRDDRSDLIAQRLEVFIQSGP